MIINDLRMSRRAFVAVAGATMGAAALGLSGCGSKSDSGSSESGAKTLKVWVPPLDDDTVNNWGKLLTDWEAANNCTVEMTIIPWEDYESSYTTALNADEGPDVGYMYFEMFPTYIDAGAVVDMASYVTADDEAEYKYLPNGNLMGGQYGWPLVTGVPFILYYNTDILGQLGESAPETWEDFERIMKAASELDGIVGFAGGMSSGDTGPLGLLNTYYYSALWQNGGQIYADDLKSVQFNDEAGKGAVEWIQTQTKYMNEDFMSLGWSEAFSNVFGAGKAAFGITRSAQTNETTFAADYPDLNWDYVTSLKNEKGIYGTFGATDSLTLMSACADPDLGMDFIKTVTGSDFMTQYHATCPGAALTNSEPYVGDEKMERIQEEDKDKWHGLQAGPCGTEILTQLANDIQGIMSGELSLEDGLAEAEKYANGLLDDYWSNK